MKLYTPGPTRLPSRVLYAMSQPMVHHRSSSFRGMVHRMRGNLKTVFGTQQEVLMFTSSGTGAMEAAITTLLAPWDGVVCVSSGLFGEMAAQIAFRHGCIAIDSRDEWGSVPTADRLRQLLADRESAVKAVILVHCETSTGAVVNLRELLAVCRDAGVLSIVDAVASVGAMEMRMDEWGADVVVAASQKGLMAPPGIGLVALSDKAMRLVRELKRGYYWNPSIMWKFQMENRFPWTPAVSTLMALDEALSMLLERPLQSTFDQHVARGFLVRQGVQKIGFKLVTPDTDESSVVTAFTVRDAPRLLSRMEDDGYMLAPGQGRREQDMLRIGHVGYMPAVDLTEMLAALERNAGEFL